MNATMSLEKIKHYPVMLNQVLSIISPQHGGTFIDCTFGGGGYSQAILKFPKTKVLAIDRDKSTQKYANFLLKSLRIYELIYLYQLQEPLFREILILPENILPRQKCSQ